MRNYEYNEGVNKRKELYEMERYNKDVAEMEQKLIKEMSGMKFSFRKLLKAIELDAVVSIYNR